MSRLAILLAIVLVASSLMSVGCCDKEKKQLVSLQQQYNDLQLSNQDLKKSLAESQSSNADLLSQLTSKESALMATQAERDELEKKLTASSGAGTGGTGAPPAGWTRTATGVKITLSSDILFAAGRATLSSAGAAKLRSIAGTINAKYAGAVTRVYGFTDSDPIRKSAKLWTDNLELSANRAMAVTRRLRKLGISAEQIETVAMGATHFIVGNTTRAGKAKNRRVEIVVVGK